MAEVVSKQQLVNAGIDAENLGKFMNDLADSPNSPHPDGTLVTRIGTVIYNLAKLQELNLTPVPKPTGENDKILSVVNNTLSYIDTFNFKLIGVGETLPPAAVYIDGALYFKEDESVFYEWDGVTWQNIGTPPKNQAFVLGNSSQYVWNGINLVSIGSGGGGGTGSTNIMQWALLDHKLTDHLLTDEESTGWLLQGSRTNLTDHTDVNKKIKEAYDTGQTKEFAYQYNFINKHCKIDDDFIVSDFWPTAYVTFNKPFKPGNAPWKIVVRARTPSEWTYQPALFAAHGYKNFEHPLLRFESGKVRLYLSSTGTAWNITGGTGVAGTFTFAVTTWYYFSLEFTGNQYIVKYSLDGITWITDLTLNSTLIQNHPETGGTQDQLYYLILGNRRLGNNDWTDCWGRYGGAIDLKETQIYIDNALYWTYRDTFEYKKADNGLCVVAQAEKALVDETYNRIGHGWFYVLHTDGTVTLPKTKNFFRIADNLENVNEYLQDQIVNIQGYIATASTSDLVGMMPARVHMSGGSGFDSMKESEAIKKSNKVGNNSYGTNYVVYSEPTYALELDASMAVNTGDQVQPRAVGQFLYFCVANVFSAMQILQAGSGINIYNDLISAYNITTKNIDKDILTDSTKEIPLEAALASDLEIPTTKAVALALENFALSGSGGFYKGVFDASKGNYDALEDIKNEDAYQVISAGVIDGVSYKFGDIIIANKTVTGIPVTADLNHYTGDETQTDEPQVLTAGSGIKIANDVISVENLTVANFNPTAITNSTEQIPASAALASDTEIPTTKAVALALEKFTASESTYKGAFDASKGNYNALTGIKQGDLYKISVAGIIGGVTYNIGDSIVANKDVTGVPVTADLDHYAATLANLTLADFASGVVNTTLPAAASASDAKIVTEKGIATALEALTPDVSNLTLSNFATGVIKTAIAEIATASDTKLVTEKAIATALSKFLTEISGIDLPNFASGVIKTTIAAVAAASDDKLVTEKAIATALASYTGAVSTNPNGWTLFDKKHSAFILQGDDVVGWLLQGNEVTHFYFAAHAFLTEMKALAVPYSCKIDISSNDETSNIRAIDCLRAPNGMMFVSTMEPLPYTYALNAYSRTNILPFFIYNELDDTYQLPINDEYWRSVSNEQHIGVQTIDTIRNLDGHFVGGYDTSGGAINVSGVFKQETTAIDNTPQIQGGTGKYFSSVSFDAGRRLNTSDKVRPSSQAELIYYYVGNVVSGVWPIELGNIITQIETKLNKSEMPTIEAYLTETWQSGDGLSWYRLYSDGWLEQGGQATQASVGTLTINLLKWYKDMNYNVNGSTNTNMSNNSVRMTRISENQFTVVFTGIFLWRACGYAYQQGEF